VPKCLRGGSELQSLHLCKTRRSGHKVEVLVEIKRIRQREEHFVHFRDKTLIDLLLCIHPIVADPDLHGERDIEGCCRFHLAFYERGGGGNFSFGSFE